MAKKITVTSSSNILCPISRGKRLLLVGNGDWYSTQPELQAQATSNKNEMDKFAENYKDYVQNDYIGQKTNQDPGKFLGSAINTLSTAADVMLP